MKKRSLLLPLVVISAIALGGCSDDQETQPAPQDDAQQSITAPDDSGSQAPETEPTSQIEPATPVDPLVSAPDTDTPEEDAALLTDATAEAQQSIQ